jgi:hypothetical protein
MIVVAKSSLLIDNMVNVVFADVKSVVYNYGKDGQNDCIHVNRMNGHQNILVHPIQGEPKDEIYASLFIKIFTDNGVLLNEMELEGFMKGDPDE